MHLRSHVLIGRLLLVLAISVVFLGCGGSSKPSGSVSGVVTFNGSPVEEGTVTFYSQEVGAAGEASLESGGSYSIADLPLGTYEVTVTPPMIEIPSRDQNSPPSEGYKQVDNIPPQFRSGKSSGLSIQIESGANTLDIAM